MKDKILLEIRDHEGGDDSKLLVDEMFFAYVKRAKRYCL